MSSIQSKHSPSTRSGTEHAAGGGRVKAARIVVGGRQRQGQATGSLIARDNTGDQFRSRGTIHLPRCDHGGDDRRSWMQRPGCVGIVEVQRMREGRIEKGRTCGGKPPRMAEYR